MRRPHLVWLLACLGVGLAAGRCGGAEAAGEQGLAVSGRVFLDSNSNGLFDPQEKGLAGVGVTDGLTFVATGPDGRYTLRASVDPLVGPDRVPIVSVSFPSRTWPVGAWHRRIEAGADAGAADFALRPAEQDLPLVFVHATDPHVPRGGKEKFIAFRRDMQALASLARFCVMTGDLVNLADSHPFDEGAAEFAFLAEQTKDFPLPLFAISGNHDAAGVTAKAGSGWDPAHPMYAYGYWRKIVGPLRWSFSAWGVHFVGVDFLHVEKGKWEWGTPETALEWLREDLERAGPAARTFLFVHAVRGRERVKGDPSSAPALPEDLLRRHKVTHIFVGHGHNDRTSQFAGAVMIESASLSQIFGEPDRQVGYRLVRVTADGVETFYRATGDEHAITIDAPRYAQAIRPGDVIRGAFYDPESRITTLTVRVDGVTADVPFERGPLACRFEARLDLAGLGPGPHTLEVSVTDGQKTWSSKGTYPAPKAAK